MLPKNIFLAALVLSCAKQTEASFDPSSSLHSDSCSNTSLVTCSEDTCPPGLFCKDGYCECGVYPYEIIRCNGTRAFVMWYDCASFDEDKNLTVVGSCHRIGKMTEFGGRFVGDRLHQQLPGKADELDRICKGLNRTGVLCGRCLPDHYPLAYSYSLTCIPCPHAHLNWLWYIMAAYLPLTLFYFIVLFFKVNITSSHLFSIVFYCQTISMPLISRAIFIEVENDGKLNNTSLLSLIKLAFSFLGIWNLDFFRPFYSDLCLGIGVLPTLALDYAIAVYPLLLILVTYLLIDLYDKNYRVVVVLWRPFQGLFALFKRNWNLRTSIIDAFATFFFLSNVKFTNVSFDFLIPTIIYQLYPRHYNYTLGLYLAGDMEYFGKEHLPYAILALIVLCVFVLLPVMVLALYPFSVFQKFISLFPFRWYVLHTFMDSFYGCYKDGTQPGTRDYRWCASVMFVLRLCLFLLYTVDDKAIYVAMITIVMILYTVIIVTLQPFKFSALNTIHIVSLQMLTIFSVAFVGGDIAAMNKGRYSLVFYAAGLIVILFTTLYIIASAVYWMYVHKRFGSALIHKLITWRRRRGYSQLLGQDEAPSDTIDDSQKCHGENLASFSTKNTDEQRS